ncbi:MAG: YciI family protein [Gammaproteobacteria bacterium]
MQYMLLIYGNERASESAPREQMTEIINAFNAFTQALRDARVWVASNRLRPTSAATWCAPQTARPSHQSIGEMAANKKATTSATF